MTSLVCPDPNWFQSLFQEAEPCPPSWDGFTIMETWCHRLLRKVAPAARWIGRPSPGSSNSLCMLCSGGLDCPYFCCHTDVLLIKSCITQPSLCLSLGCLCKRSWRIYPGLLFRALLCDLCSMMSVSHPGVEFEVLGGCSNR